MNNRFKNEEENQNSQTNPNQYSSNQTSRDRNSFSSGGFDSERSDRDESRYGSPRNFERDQFSDQQSHANFGKPSRGLNSRHNLGGRPGEYSAASGSYTDNNSAKSMDNSDMQNYQNPYSQTRQSSPSEKQGRGREGNNKWNNEQQNENRPHSNGYASTNKNNGQGFGGYKSSGNPTQYSGENYEDRNSQDGYYTQVDGHVDQNFSGEPFRNQNDGGGYQGNYEGRPNTMQHNPPSTFGTYSNDIQNSRGSSGAQYQSLRPGTSSHRGKGPKGYKRSDERIKEDVCESFHDHHDIDASDIDVEVKNGEVTLSGTVQSRDMKRLAEDTIEGLSGVKEVINNIRLGKNSDSRMNSINSNDRNESDSDSSKLKSSNPNTNVNDKLDSENDVSKTKLNGKRENESQKPNTRLS